MVRVAMARIGRSFFERAPDDVARDLIGTHMTVTTMSGTIRVRIVETEAYSGSEDPASHAYRGRTQRNAVMFGPAGHLYVYRSYGIHWCVNVVTGRPGVAGAVLLRAADDFMVLRRDADTDIAELSMTGPGNLTRTLGITGADDGVDCCKKDARVTFFTRSAEVAVARSERVGITKAVEQLSRYYLEGNRAVSKARTSPRSE
jgi:DNA-3-methyladenine glycosylase